MQTLNYSNSLRGQYTGLSVYIVMILWIMILWTLLKNPYSVHRWQAICLIMNLTVLHVKPETLKACTVCTVRLLKCVHYWVMAAGAGDSGVNGSGFIWFRFTITLSYSLCHCSGVSVDGLVSRNLYASWVCKLKMFLAFRQDSPNSFQFWKI